MVFHHEQTLDDSSYTRSGFRMSYVVFDRSKKDRQAVTPVTERGPNTLVLDGVTNASTWRSVRNGKGWKR
jgi:hypothetical protein